MRYYGANATRFESLTAPLVRKLTGETMTRAFEATPEHPAVAHLILLYADINGKLLENKKEARRLAESMEHVEHVIRLFDPSFNAREIAPRRRYKGNGWFRRGTILRHALDVLRKFQAALTSREIAEHMLVAKGVRNDASPEALRSLTASVHKSLQNYDSKTVMNVGEGMPARWKVIS